MVLPINELKPEQTDAIAKFMRIVTTRRFYSETCSVATDDIEARGAIVNFTTGGGKTLVALGAVRALMDKGLIDHVVILVPTPTLVQQWKSQFFEKSLASASDINGLEIPSQIKGVELDARPCSDQRIEYEDQNIFCVRAAGVGAYIRVAIGVYNDYRILPSQNSHVTNTTFYILDEVQNVHAVISSGANPHLLSTISRDATYCLGLSATPIVDDVLDLVYALHLVAAPSDTLASLFPLSANQFKRKYSSVSTWKSVIFGYLGPLMNIKLGGGVIFITFVLGTLDYYNMQDLQVRAKRLAFIDKIFARFGPLLTQGIGAHARSAKEAFTEFNLSWRAVRRLYSTLIFFALADPFHVLIPAVVASFMLTNASESIFTYDYKRLASTVSPVLIKRAESPVIAMGTLETLVETAKQFLGHRDVRYERIAAAADVPAIVVASRKVNYNQPNAKTLYHLSTRMLTMTELRKLLGRPNLTQHEYESSPLVQGSRVDDRYVVDVGRMIGNLIYTEQDLVDIKTEYSARVRFQAKSLGIDAIMREFAAVKSPPPPHPHSPLGQRYVPNSKFDAIIGRITHMLTHDPVLKNQPTFRVCVFSEFWHAVINLQKYMKANAAFMSLVASLDLMPRMNEGEDDNNSHMVATYNSQAGINKRKVRILLLGPEYAEGFSGINNTFVMFILEPVTSYARLLQIRGRVARKNTHTRDVKQVLIVELCASLTLYRKTFLRFLQRDRARIHKDTSLYLLPGLERLLTSQTVTPDEIILGQQKASRKLDAAINNTIQECGDFVGWRSPHIKPDVINKRP